MNIILSKSDSEIVPKGTIITMGSFDGVHLGHQKIFESMRSLSKLHGAPTLVVTFDPHPRQIIYPKAGDLELLTTPQEKHEELSKCGIDYLFIQSFSVEFSQLPAPLFIRRFIVECLAPSVIVMGYDHRFGLNRQGDFNLMKAASTKYGFQVEEIDQFLVEENKISSTSIRNALKEGKPDVANKLLGRPYSFKGEVIHGEKLGEKLGYKTANLEPLGKNKLIPKPGIYAVLITHQEVVFGGMMYIGTKPTFSKSEKIFIEVNIFDFNHILYGQVLDIQVLRYIRQDMTFPSREGLIKRMDLDKKETLQILKDYNIENAGFQYS